MTILAVGEHEISDVDLVIFDKDGTLMDLHSYWVPVAQLRAQIIKKKIENVVLEELMTIMGVNCECYRLMPGSIIGFATRVANVRAVANYLVTKTRRRFTEEFIFQAFEEADYAIQDSLEEITRPTPGAAKFLSELRHCKCYTAVATNDFAERTYNLLKHMGFEQKIDCVIGADQVTHGKPHPEMVFNLLKKMGIKQDRAVIIGDSPNDLAMGLNAGLRASIGVVNDLFSYEEMFSLTPYIISNFNCIHVLK